MNSFSSRFGPFSNTPVTVDSTDATDVSQMNTAEVDNDISTKPDSDLPLSRSTCAVYNNQYLLSKTSLIDTQMVYS